MTTSDAQTLHLRAANMCFRALYGINLRFERIHMKCDSSVRCVGCGKLLIPEGRRACLTPVFSEAREIVHCFMLVEARVPRDAQRVGKLLLRLVHPSTRPKMKSLDVVRQHFAVLRPAQGLRDAQHVDITLHTKQRDCHEITKKWINVLALKRLGEKRHGTV